MRRAARRLGILVAALAAPAGPAPSAPPAGEATGVIVERRFAAMGTACAVVGRAPSRDTGLAAIEAARGVIAAVEGVLSTWRPDTDLARLNAAPPGTPHPVSPDLLAMLLEVARLREETGGAFDPAVGALVEAWGLRAGGRIPTAPELALARAATGLHLLVLDPVARTATRLPPGPILDAGAFGKGEALARAGVVLDGAGLRDWSIDFGGQIHCGGGGACEADIAHPRHRDRAVGRLRLVAASASSSGNAEQARQVGERRIGHILDPRRGEPAPDFGSVTVVCPGPLRADALSTALFVMGPEQGLPFAAGLPDCEALFLIADDGGEPRWLATDGFAALLVADSSGTPRPETEGAAPPKHGGAR